MALSIHTFAIKKVSTFGAWYTALAQRGAGLKTVAHKNTWLESVETVRQICVRFELPFTPACVEVVGYLSGMAKDGKAQVFERNNWLDPDFGNVAAANKHLIVDIPCGDILQVSGRL